MPKIDPRFQPLVSALGNTLGQLLSRAADGAVENVLDEVQGKVREIEERIGSARKKVKSRRVAASKVRPAREKDEPEIIVVDEPSRH